MKIAASGLEARNIGQIVTVEQGGDVLMGRVERVKFTAAGMVCLRVSGETLQLDREHEVDIRRSVEAGMAHRLNRNIEDVLDDGRGEMVLLDPMAGMIA